MQPTRRRAAATLFAAAAAAALAPARAQASAEAPPALSPRVEPGASGGPAVGGPLPDPVAGGHDGFDHMTAPVSVNGQGPFCFVVDTGANVSCISRRLAEALALPLQDARPMHTVVGVRAQPMALIEELRVGARTQKAVSMPAVGLDNPKIDGVLGVDGLQDQRLTLDFSRNQLQFARSHDDWRREGRVIVPARRRLGQLTIIDAELGGREISAMIDSGSEASLCNSALMKLLDRPNRRGKRLIVPMVSILGEPFQGEMVYLPFLRLGGLQLGAVPVVFADTHVFEIWGLEDKPAVLLGMDLLRQFRAVSLDFGRSQVRFDLLA